VAVAGARRAAAALALVTLAACERAAPQPRGAARTTAADTPSASVARPPGYVVDSAVPIEVALDRFRSGLPEVRALEGGATSRDGLVRSFVRAVERSDSAALGRLQISRAEFAYLVYPSSPFTRPPFRQQPEVSWLLQRTAGDAGLGALYRGLAGRALGFDGYSCAPAPTAEGENRLWRGCRVRYRNAAGAPAEGALFGVIVERGGQFKFVNYANDL
jgi:hypothetical protein